MATAKKLPSGQFRARVYDKARKTTKSFTAPTKMEAEVAAARWLKSSQFTEKSENPVDQHFVDVNKT